MIGSIIDSILERELVINLEGKAGLKKINGSKSGDKIIIPLNTTGEITTALYAPETSTIFEGKSIIESYYQFGSLLF